MTSVLIGQERGDSVNPAAAGTGGEEAWVAGGGCLGAPVCGPFLASAWGGSQAEGPVQSWIPPPTVEETEYNAHGFQLKSLRARGYFLLALLFDYELDT